MKSIRIITAFSFAALPFAMYVGGCSSSTTTNGGFGDGGSSGSSSGVVHPDASGSGSGSGSSSGSGSGSGSSSGSGDDGGGSSSGASDGGACPGPVSSSMISQYATVKQTLNACSSTQISGFVQACTGMTGSMSACQSWQQANMSCLACMVGNPANTGALLLDSSGMQIVDFNVPGCIALKDTTNGPACAKALTPDLYCDDYACGGCADQNTFNTCIGTVEGTGGSCAMYGGPVQTSCASDFGDAGVANTACGDISSIINVICGTGQ